jgi:hypothetical protein
MFNTLMGSGEDFVKDLGFNATIFALKEVLSYRDKNLYGENSI